MEDRRFLRRNFLSNLALLGAAGAATGSKSLAAAVTGDDSPYQLPEYACAQSYRSLKQSSYDRTAVTATHGPLLRARPRRSLVRTDQASSRTSGSPFAAESRFHLKEIVLRIYWDGGSKPSVEVPVGDFFRLEFK